jgi:hypothetical protein
MTYYYSPFIKQTKRLTVANKHKETLNIMNLLGSTNPNTNITSDPIRMATVKKKGKNKELESLKPWCIVAL